MLDEGRRQALSLPTCSGFPTDWVFFGMRAAYRLSGNGLARSSLDTYTDGPMLTGPPLTPSLTTHTVHYSFSRTEAAEH